MRSGLEWVEEYAGSERRDRDAVRRRQHRPCPLRRRPAARRRTGHGVELLDRDGDDPGPDHRRRGRLLRRRARTGRRKRCSARSGSPRSSTTSTTRRDERRLGDRHVGPGFARFGLLYLRRRWDGTQIVPGSGSTTPACRCPMRQRTGPTGGSSARRTAVRRRSRRTGSTGVDHDRPRARPRGRHARRRAGSGARPRRRPRHRGVRRRLSLTVRRDTRAVADRSDEGGDGGRRADRRRVDVRAEVGRSSGARAARRRRLRRRQLDRQAEAPAVAVAGHGGRRRRPTTTSSSTARSSPTTTTAGTRSRASAEPDRDHAFVVFDLLALDGDDLRDRPWSERRALLEASVRPTSPLTITPVSDDAEVMEAATRAQRFEGIVAKRVDVDVPVRAAGPGVGEGQVHATRRRWSSAATSSARATAPGRSARCSSASTTTSGDLQFVSAVGTGFNERTLTDVMAKLRQLETDECPFAVAAEAAARHLPMGAPRARRPGRVPRVDRGRRPPRAGVPRPPRRQAPGRRRPRDLATVPAECLRPPECFRRDTSARTLGRRNTRVRRTCGRGSCAPWGLLGLGRRRRPSSPASPSPAWRWSTTGGAASPPGPRRGWPRGRRRGR